MTSLALVGWIVLGIGLQLLLWLGIEFWRHWQTYRALRDEPPTSTTLPASVAEPAIVAAWSGFRTFRVANKVVEDAAQSVCSFHLVPEDQQPLPAFLPGQFLSFRLDVPTADGETEPLVRCYSLSDQPASDHYRVSIKQMPDGRISRHFHEQVQLGTLVQVRAPGGHFHIERSDSPVVLIAGGIGITPMLSMLNWCLAEQPGREVWLYYGVRNSRELVLPAHLAAMAATHPQFHLRLCFSNPLPEDQLGRDYQHHGRVDVSVLRNQLPLKPYHFYLCGPTAMLESLVPALEDWGVPDAHIHFEAFGPASVKRRNQAVAAPRAEAAASSDIVVTFAKSGRQFPWQAGAGSLLEFAEAQGITVNSGCRVGSCGSCQTVIGGGEVRYLNPPEFDPDAGSCLLCVCAPKTSVILEA